MSIGKLAHFANEGWDLKIAESLHDLRQAGLVVHELTTVVDNKQVKNPKDGVQELFFDDLYIISSNQRLSSRTAST